MANKDFTQLVKMLYEQDQNDILIKETHQEIEANGLDELLREVKQILAKERPRSSNVIAFPRKVEKFAETTLMAAAGQNLDSWFAHPIVFSASGFMVDIRKVLGSDNEVDVYIQPSGQDTKSIEQSLAPFKAKTLKINFSIDGISLLNAEVYVDENGLGAEGEGVISVVDSEGLQGKLSLDVEVME